MLFDFKDGNKKVVNNAQSGRPSTAVTDVNTDSAEWREIIIKGIVWQFKRVTGKGSQYRYSGMGMRLVCERWSPHDFSDKQKWKHVKVWKRNVPFDEQNSNLSLFIITCNGVLVTTSWPRAETAVSSLEKKICCHQGIFTSSRKVILIVVDSKTIMPRQLWMIFTMQIHTELT